MRSHSLYVEGDEQAHSLVLKGAEDVEYSEGSDPTRAEKQEKKGDEEMAYLRMR